MYLVKDGLDLDRCSIADVMFGVQAPSLISLLTVVAVSGLCWGEGGWEGSMGGRGGRSKGNHRAAEGELEECWLNVKISLSLSLCVITKVSMWRHDLRVHKTANWEEIFTIELILGIRFYQYSFASVLYLMDKDCSNNGLIWMFNYIDRTEFDYIMCIGLFKIILNRRNTYRLP